MMLPRINLLLPGQSQTMLAAILLLSRPAVLYISLPSYHLNQKREREREREREKELAKICLEDLRVSKDFFRHTCHEKYLHLDT
jgi:hypothetical protein